MHALEEALDEEDELVLALDDERVAGAGHDDERRDRESVGDGLRALERHRGVAPGGDDEDGAGDLRQDGPQVDPLERREEALEAREPDLRQERDLRPPRGDLLRVSRLPLGRVGEVDDRVVDLGPIAASRGRAHRAAEPLARLPEAGVADPRHIRDRGRDDGSDALRVAGREEEAHVSAVRGRDDVDALLSEGFEERRDVVRVLLHGRARRARREQLAPEVAADHTMARSEPARDRLPRRERHHPAVEEQKGGALALHLVREDAHPGTSEEAEKEDFFER